MATSYTGLRVQDTYNAIIKIGDNSNLSGTAKLLSDGLGNDSPLYLSGTRLGIGISPAYQFHTSGNAKIGGNLIISGNLTVNGTLTYLNVEDLQVEDPLIKLAKDNTSNTLDIGFFGKYVESATTKYTGLFWDASTDKFRLYEGLQVEPTTTVDVTGTGYTRSLLNADLEGNVTGTVSSLSNHDTNDLVEGSFNLYYTNARADARVNLQTGVNLDLSSKDTDDLSEGTTNLYYTDARFDTRFTSKDTDNLSEGTTNLYFTTARARASFSAGDGITITNGVISSEGDAEVAKRLEVTVKNVSGGSLAKGVVVHAAPTATPPSGNVIEVVAADANVAASMPAIGVLNETIANDAEGEAVMFGAVSGIDTSSFTAGDELYVSETAGAFTATKPTAFTSQVQKIAVVIKSHASNGSIKVFGAGRSNDIPNRVDRDMNFTDGSKLEFGTDSDLEIYHDGTDGYIDNINGELIIQNNSNDKKIIFKSDNGIGDITEYFRIDGNINRNVITVTTQLNDNVPLIFGSGAGSPSIKYDSTATQLFIDGESKFLNDLYVVGDLIVDTDTLFVDVSANKVGINNSAPGAMLTVGAAINANATGLEVNAGTDGGNIISRGAGYDNWFPYTNGQNYYSSDTHNFRNSTSSAIQLTIDSTGNGVFNGNVTAARFIGPLTGNVTGNLTGNVTGGTISGTTGTFSDIVYVGDDASANEGVYIKSGNGTSDYGVVRFYHGGTNRNTIHAFSQYWQSGNIYNSATDSLNLDGHAGVTIGSWNDIDVAFVQGSTNYFQRAIGIGQTTPLSSLHITQSIPSITLETSTDANDPVITLKSSQAITGEGAQMYYDNSVGTFHIQTTYPNDVADIVFHTATGADQGTNNVRMRIGGGGGVGIGDVQANGDLQFTNDVQTRKIVLYEGADNDYQFYGFGIETGTLIYSTYLESDSHVFVSGASATTRTEIMRITADTGVRVGTGSVDAKFKVEARDTSNNIYAGFRVGYNGGSANYYDANSHEIRSGSSGTTYLTINSSGASFNKSIIIGTGGTYAAGAIYSDSNYGMIFRAKQASPGTADFLFTNSANVERLRITSTAATFAGEVNLVRGINMTAGTSNLYATDGALSYYAASNGVYLNGAGASGWLRLQASGVQNDRNSINIYGYSAGAYITFRTENIERLKIDSNGDFQASVNLDKNYEFGKAHIGYMGHADHAGFSHIDINSTGGYALLQDSGGTTYLNAASSKKIYFRNNNQDLGAFSAVGNLGVGTTDPDAFMSGTKGISIVSSSNASLGLSNGTTKWLTYLTTNADRYRFWNSTSNEVMTILLSGYVGIGIDTPTATLHVKNDQSTSWLTISETQGTGGGGYYFNGTSITQSASKVLLVSTTSNVDTFAIKPSGRIGIGTGVPDGILQVQGKNGATIYSQLLMGYNGTSSNFYDGDTQTFRTGGGVNKMVITTNGTTFFSPATGTASGDYTNVQYYPYKVDSATQSSDYWRIPHISGSASISGVYNYETGKNVYWGEPADTGTYEFRGRYINATSSNTVVGAFHNDLGSCIFKIGDASNSSYSDLQLYSNSGTGEIFKAGTAYTGWGGALALNIFNSNGDICFHPSGTANIMKVKTSGITVTGSVTASGDVIAFSDKRVKTNIKTIDNGLQKVLNLRGVSYNRTDIDDNSDKIGVIAQEVKEVLPEVVKYNKEDDKYGVDYGKMAGVFIEAIKELKAEVDSLKQEIKELKK